MSSEDISRFGTVELDRSEILNLMQEFASNDRAYVSEFTADAYGLVDTRYENGHQVVKDIQVYFKSILEGVG